MLPHLFFLQKNSSWSGFCDQHLLFSTHAVGFNSLRIRCYGHRLWHFIFTAHTVVFSEVVQPLIPNIRFVVSRVLFHLKVITLIYSRNAVFVEIWYKAVVCLSPVFTKDLHGWISPPSQTAPFAFFSEVVGVVVRPFEFLPPTSVPDKWLQIVPLQDWGVDSLVANEIA